MKRLINKIFIGIIMGCILFSFVACGEKKSESIDIDLQFDESLVSPDIANAIEKYFLCIQNNDFETYESLQHPGYIQYLSPYLNEKYNYGLDSSFNYQYTNLKNTAGGDYEFTSINISPATEDSTSEYFNMLDNFFGLENNEFSKNINETSSEIFDLIVSINAKCNGNDIVLLNQIEMFWALSNSSYYTFG